MDDGECMFHLQLARVTIGEERSNRLILILLGNISNNKMCFVLRQILKKQEWRQNDEQEQDFFGIN